jgi:hypothetical protein
MLCFVSVFFFEIVNNGGCQGDTSQAFAQWWHLVALHEATDALHQAMCTTPYCSGGMAIKIVVFLPDFFVIVNSALPITIAK